MKIAIIVSIFMLGLLFLSIKIILFSASDISTKKKILLVNSDGSSEEGSNFADDMITTERVPKDLKKATSFYKAVFLLKGIKFKRSKDFRDYYKLYRIALKYWKKKNYPAAKRRLDHIISFLDESYLLDLLLKGRAYFLLSDIAEKNKNSKASAAYMERFMKVYKKILQNPKLKNLKARLQLRQFLSASFSGIKANEKME